MAQKRKAEEAFGQPRGRLSAVAAAKLARQHASITPSLDSQLETTSLRAELVAEVAGVPYDGHHSRASTPDDFASDDDILDKPPVRSPRPPLSTFAPTKSNVLKDDHDCLELLLQPGQTVALLGVYDLEVLVSSQGVEVAGYVHRTKTPAQRIYAPSTHPLPLIRALGHNAIIRITSVKSGIEKLESLSPLFRNVWNTVAHGERSFALIGMLEDEQLQRSLSAIETSQELQAVLRALGSKSKALPYDTRIAAVGPKSSGKSMFNRLLCNHIIMLAPNAKVLYLDLDTGQPEFGPPGQISLVEVSAPLLGPPFTHLSSLQDKDFKLVKCHTIAATSFKDDPEHYKACVIDLVRHCDKRHPVVVNLCGWVSGIGIEVLGQLISRLAISDLVLLDPLDESLTAFLRSQMSEATFHQVPRYTPRPPSRTPGQHRAMQTMAYFHHRAGLRDSPHEWSGRPLSKLRPWIVDYPAFDAAFLAVMSYGQSPEPDFLAEVLDGSIVAMVALDDNVDGSNIFLQQATKQSEGPITGELTDLIEHTPEGIPYIRPNSQGINRTLNPRTSQCVGLALIRSIDTEQNQFHLITPLPESQIMSLRKKQIALVRGSFDPPEWAYLEDLYKDEADGSEVKTDAVDRPWVSEKERVGIEGSVWRLRHPPTAATVAGTR